MPLPPLSMASVALGVPRQPSVALVGAPEGFTPLVLPGLLLWLEAGRLTGLNDGDPVTTYTGQSIAGNSPTQATASKKPTYHRGVVAGNPSVLWDAVDDEMESPSVTHGIGTGDFCYSAAVRAPVMADAAYRAIVENGGFSPAFYIHQVAGAERVNLYWATDHRFDTNLVAGTWYVLTVLRRSGTVSCRVNGVAEATTYALATSMANAAIAVGNDPGAGGAAFGDYISGLTFYSNAPSGASLTLLERYLGRLVGVTI